MTDAAASAARGESTARPAARQRVVVEQRGQATWFAVNEQAQENRLSLATLEALGDELRRYSSHDDCRVVVLTGSGGIFCPGGRIDGLSEGLTSAQQAFASSFVELLGVLDALEVPVISAVNGRCHAAGMSLLHASDLAISVDTATFGYPEINVGLFPMLAMSGAEHALPRKVLFDLWYTGRLFGAQEALELHLVNEVVPAEQLQSRVDGMVAALVDRSPEALSHGRRAYHSIRRMSPDAAMRHAQVALVSLLANSAGRDSPWAANVAESSQDDPDEGLLT